MRELVAEYQVRPADLVLPVFAREGIDEPVPVSSMPGVVQHTRDSLRRAAAEAAKADGRWAAAYRASEAEVPDDLLAAIAADPEAQRMFDVLTKSNRFALCHRLNAVKKAETRQRKIREFVAMLARHEAPYPQKARPE